MVSGEQTECSCRKFQFVGILCSHVLKVFSLENISTIPEKYILRRWTKEAKDGCSRGVHGATMSDDPKISMGMRYKELCWLFTQLAAKAAKSEGTYKAAIEGHTTILDHVEELLKSLTLDESVKAKTTPTVNVSKGFKVKGVKVKAKSNEDKSSKRKVGAFEKAVKRKRVGKKDVPIEKDKVGATTTLQNTQYIIANPQTGMSQIETFDTTSQCPLKDMDMNYSKHMGSGMQKQADIFGTASFDYGLSDGNLLYQDSFTQVHMGLNNANLSTFDGDVLSWNHVAQPRFEMFRPQQLQQNQLVPPFICPRAHYTAGSLGALPVSHHPTSAPQSHHLAAYRVPQQQHIHFVSQPTGQSQQASSVSKQKKAPAKQKSATE